MRALYLIGIIFSVVFAIVTLYFIEEYLLHVNRLHIKYYDPNQNVYGELETIKITSAWSLASLFFFCYFIIMDILGLVKIKRRTTKVLSIIGLSITGVMLSWDLMVMSSPSHISVDEVGGVWLFYAFIYFVFSIVGIVQAVKWRNRHHIKTDDSLLDDFLNEEI